MRHGGCLKTRKRRRNVQEGRTTRKIYSKKVIWIDR